MVASMSLCVVVLAACYGVANAAVPTPRELLTSIPKPLSAVSIDYTFPSVAHPQQIVSGEDVTALITVRNDHTAPLNVTYLTGSINSAKDFNVFLQNFTTTAYGSSVREGTERSFEYTFSTDPRMPARAFRVALTVFYADKSGSTAYAATFFNQTVEMVEADKMIDTEAMSLFLTLAAIVGAVGYVIFSFMKDQQWYKDWTKKAGKKAKVPVVETMGPTDKSDYLIGTPYHAQEKRKERQSKKVS